MTAGWHSSTKFMIWLHLFSKIFSVNNSIHSIIIEVLNSKYLKQSSCIYKTSHSSCRNRYYLLVWSQNKRASKINWSWHRIGVILLPKRNLLTHISFWTRKQIRCVGSSNTVRDICWFGCWNNYCSFLVGGETHSIS